MYVTGEPHTSNIEYCPGQDATKIVFQNQYFQMLFVVSQKHLD